MYNCSPVVWRPTSAAITITDHSKRFSDDVLALGDVDLEVREGELFGFLGPNAPTINVLLDFARPTSGRVSVLGMTLGRGVTTAIPVLLGFAVAFALLGSVNVVDSALFVGVTVLFAFAYPRFTSADLRVGPLRPSLASLAVPTTERPRRFGTGRFNSTARVRRRVPSLLENDAVRWTASSVLLFAPAAVVISLLAPPDASALSTLLLGVNALFAWTVGYWLVYRGGLDALQGTH